MRGQHRRIEQYVSGNMTDTEKLKFEQALAKSDELRAMVEAEKEIVAILNADKDSLPPVAAEPAVHLVARLHSTPAQASPVSGFGNRMWWSISSWWIPMLAGAIVTGAAVGIGLVLMPDSSTTPIQPVMLRDTVYVPVVPPGAGDTDILKPVPDTRAGGEHLPTAREKRANTTRERPPIPAAAPHSRQEDRATLKEFLDRSERTAPVQKKRRDSVEIRVNVGK